MKSTWTPAEIQTLCERYPHERSADLAASMGRPLRQVYNKAVELGIKKTAAYLGSALSGRTDGKKGEHTRFQKGHQTWNKGLSWHSGGRYAETQFKPGCTPPNRRAVGDIRLNSEGYLDIKTAPGARKWVALHRWNWKLAHGEFPPPGMALVFRDGNRQNCDISNLELITRRELGRRNSVNNLPEEIKEVIRLNTWVKRKINGK